MKLEQVEANVEKKLLSSYEDKAERKLHPYLAKTFQITNEIGLLGLMGSLVTFAFTIGSSPALGMACLLGVVPISLGVLTMSYAVNSYIEAKTAQKDMAEDIKNGVYQEQYKRGLESFAEKIDADQKAAFDQAVEGVSTKFNYEAALKEAQRRPYTPIVDFSKAAGKVIRDKSQAFGKTVREKRQNASKVIKAKSLDLVNKIKKIVHKKD